MENKTVRNIVIAGAMILGTGYVLKKAKEVREQRILENINTDQYDKSQNYILTGEVYKELMNDSNNQKSDETGFSNADRNYFRLK